MTLSIRKIKKLLVVITTILILTILALFSLRTETKEKAIAQGISVASTSLESMSYNDAAVKMDKAFSSLLDEPILLELNGNVQSTPLKNLGVSFNTIKTLEEVLVILRV